MSVDVVTDESSSPGSARRIALSLAPFVALAFGIGLAMLWGLTLPSSRSPSDDAATDLVVVMWFAAGVCLVASAWCAGGRRSLRGALIAVGVVGLSTLGWLVARRFDAVWVDACGYGQSGDRCVGGNGSAPLWVMAAWPTAGILIAATCALVAAVGRHAASA